MKVTITCLHIDHELSQVRFTIGSKAFLLVEVANREESRDHSLFMAQMLEQAFKKIQGKDFEVVLEELDY